MEYRETFLIVKLKCTEGRILAIIGGRITIHIASLTGYKAAFPPRICSASQPFRGKYRHSIYHRVSLHITYTVMQVCKDQLILCKLFCTWFAMAPNNNSLHFVSLMYWLNQSVCLSKEPHNGSVWKHEDIYKVV